MSTVRALPTPAARASTFRAMARARHTTVVELFKEGKRDAGFAMLRDVEQLDDLARDEEERARRIWAQQRVRADVVSDLDGLIRLVRKDVEDAC